MKTVTSEHYEAKGREKIEKYFGMETLEGSEKQVTWASDIRHRYGIYLLVRFPQEAKAKFDKESEASKGQAKYWIDNRYGLTATNKQSQYVASGSGIIEQ